VAGDLPGGAEVELGLLIIGRSGGSAKVLALDRVARELRAGCTVLAEREARPEDVAACYAGLRDPDDRARVRFRLKLLLGMAEEEEGPLPDAFWVEALGGRRDVERMARDMERLGLFGPEGGRDGRR
jgi:hypothetical protein